MELIAERGRRVSVEELNTTQASGACAKAGGAAQIRRHADRRLRRAPLRERELRRDPSVHGERRAATADDRRARLRPARHRAVAGRLHPGHGRTRHALSAAAVGEDRSRPDARRPARRALDGRHGRRLFVPVPDRHAQYRSASAEGDGERAVLGLQSLAHGEGAAGDARAACTPCCACRSPIRTSPCATSRPSAIARASPASW